MRDKPAMPDWLSADRESAVVRKRVASLPSMGPGEENRTSAAARPPSIRCDIPNPDYPIHLPCFRRLFIAF
jgi:hypothetical protein